MSSPAVVSPNYNVGMHQGQSGVATASGLASTSGGANDSANSSMGRQLQVLEPLRQSMEQWRQRSREKTQHFLHTQPVNRERQAKETAALRQRFLDDAIKKEQSAKSRHPSTNAQIASVAGAKFLSSSSSVPRNLASPGAARLTNGMQSAHSDISKQLSANRGLGKRKSSEQQLIASNNSWNNLERHLSADAVAQQIFSRHVPIVLDTGPAEKAAMVESFRLAGSSLAPETPATYPTVVSQPFVSQSTTSNQVQHLVGVVSVPSSGQNGASASSSSMVSSNQQFPLFSMPQQQTSNNSSALSTPSRQSNNTFLLANTDLSTPSHNGLAGYLDLNLNGADRSFDGTQELEQILREFTGGGRLPDQNAQDVDEFFKILENDTPESPPLIASLQVSGRDGEGASQRLAWMAGQHDRTDIANAVVSSSVCSNNSNASPLANSAALDNQQHQPVTSYHSNFATVAQQQNSFVNEIRSQPGAQVIQQNSSVTSLNQASVAMQASQRPSLQAQRQHQQFAQWPQQQQMHKSHTMPNGSVNAAVGHNALYAQHNGMVYHTQQPQSSATPVQMINGRQVINAQLTQQPTQLIRGANGQIMPAQFNQSFTGQQQQQQHQWQEINLVQQRIPQFTAQAPELRYPVQLQQNVNGNNMAAAMSYGYATTANGSQEYVVVQPAQAVLLQGATPRAHNLQQVHLQAAHAYPQQQRWHSAQQPF